MEFLASFVLITTGAIAVQLMRIEDPIGFMDSVSSAGTYLAGIGTIALAYFAREAKNEWKRQIDYKDQKECMLDLMIAFDEWRDSHHAVATEIETWFSYLESDEEYKANPNPPKTEPPTEQYVISFKESLDRSNDRLSEALTRAAYHEINILSSWRMVRFATNRNASVWWRLIENAGQTGDLDYLFEELKASHRLHQGFMKNIRGNTLRLSGELVSLRREILGLDK